MILSVVCVLVASKYGDKAAWPDLLIWMQTANF